MVAGFIKMLLPITAPATMEMHAHVPSLRSSVGEDMQLLHKFCNEAMKMMCALLTCYRVASVIIEP
jgi:hypothetical protein